MVSGKPGVPRPSFLCAASFSLLVCHSGQKRPERKLLSTKSRAVPAEGVAPLTLHKPVMPSLRVFGQKLCLSFAEGF